MGDVFLLIFLTFLTSGREIIRPKASILLLKNKYTQKIPHYYPHGVWGPVPRLPGHWPAIRLGPLHFSIPATRKTIPRLPKQNIWDAKISGPGWQKFIAGLSICCFFPATFLVRSLFGRFLYMFLILFAAIFNFE